MFFILLVYIAALTLESLGSYISVIGLAAKTGLILIFLAVTLDFSKIMIASVLYKRWKDLHLLLRCILVPVLVFLVTVTSTGTYAYLMQEFSKTTASTEQQKVQIDLMQKEKEKLEDRKKAIDNQIAQLPPNSVVQRKRLTELFAKESTYINDRLMTLDKELPEAQVRVMQDSGHSGTLGSIATAYNVSPEQVSRIVAFFIVLVIDPLAIVLLTVANFLVEQRKKDIAANKNNYLKEIQQNASYWDKFKYNLFGSKDILFIKNKPFIRSHTDSEGKLFKDKIILSSHGFIQSTENFITEIKPIEFMKSQPIVLNLLNEYLPKTPKLSKEKTHLISKKPIQKIEEDTNIQSYSFKLNSHTLFTQNFIQDFIESPQIEKAFVESLHLDVSNVIAHAALAEEHVIPLGHERKLVAEAKHYLHVSSLLQETEIDEEGLLNATDGEYISDTINTHEHQKVKESVQSFLQQQPVLLNKEIIQEAHVITKPKPQTLPHIKLINTGGFFDGVENSTFVVSNNPEDIYKEIDLELEEEDGFWNSNNYHLDLALRPIFFSRIEGFNLKQLNQMKSF